MKHLILEIYNEEKQLIKTETFPLESYVRFDYSESIAGASFSLNNLNLENTNSQVKQIFNTVRDGSEAAGSIKVSLQVDALLLIELDNVRNINYLIGDKTLISDDGRSVIMETLSFIAS